MEGERIFALRAKRAAMAMDNDQALTLYRAAADMMGGKPSDYVAVEICTLTLFLSTEN